MIVAEIYIRTSTSFGYAMADCVVPFSDLEKARAEYERLAELLKSPERRNGEERIICNGNCGIEASVKLSTVHSVGFSDFAKMNEQRVGMKDAFPLLFQKP